MSGDTSYNSTKLTRLFVYGSLMTGESNHRVMRGARCLGPTSTVAAFELFDLGAFPGLVRGGATSVVGELFEVDDEGLARLDEFEGHPTFYERGSIVLVDGAEVDAYLLPRARVIGRPVVAGGDWRARARSGSSPR